MVNLRENENEVIMEARGEQKASVIWLHGLGADAYDFQPIVALMKLPPELGIRFIFPHAPVQPVTINGGYPMRAWYDILRADLDREVDTKGVNSSVQRIKTLIDRELERAVAPEKIILAGFSQGGAVALRAGLSMDKKLAGIMALSTYLLDFAMESYVTAQGKKTPVFMAHGKDDAIVSLSLAEKSRDSIVSQGNEMEWKTYKMGHSVSDEEIIHMAQWLKTRLS